MADIMVLFDFDKTIMDWECDDWIVHELGLTDLIDELRPTMPWNSLMVNSCFFFSVWFAFSHIIIFFGRTHERFI